MQQAHGITVIVFAGAVKLIVCLDHEVAFRARADPLAMRFNQVFDRRSYFALTNFKRRKYIFSIDFFDERLARDSKVPALVGLKESQDLSFEVV